MIVLAAGRGTRMGGPKALMDVGGRAWWRVQERRLRQAGVTPWWVIVPGDWTTMPTGRWVAGRAGSPMFESVRAGVAAVQAASARSAGPVPVGVFVLPVDVPAASPEVWSALLEALTSPPGPRPIVPAFDGQTGHPLLLPWNWAVERVLPAPEGARLDEMIRESVSAIEVRDANVRANLNTPAEAAGWNESNPRG
ncbi:MAG: NTP transferase domain-containing protein [Phycisphaerales bacterium]